MPSLINYQAAAKNFYNPSFSSQYGVGMSDGQLLQSASGAASSIPYVGPIIGAFMNIAGQILQNQQQEAFYNDYMSPAARMRQMVAAGINPNAAAEGISGASAPQMNAASPTSAFSGLGEQLGNSANTALTADSIIADTRMKKESAKSLSLDNSMKEIELGMKPDLLQAELDDLKESANQRRQLVEQSKKEVEKYDAEIDKLKEEKEFIIAQKGLVEYEQKLKEAETNAANARAALDKANKDLAEVNKQIQEKERDNYLTPEQRIEKENKYRVKSEVEETPQGRLSLEYEQQMNAELKEVDDEIARVRNNGKTGLWHEYELSNLEARRNRIIQKYRNKIRRINKGGNAGVTVAGSGVYAGG